MAPKKECVLLLGATVHLKVANVVSKCCYVLETNLLEFKFRASDFTDLQVSFSAWGTSKRLSVGYLKLASICLFARP